MKYKFDELMEDAFRPIPAGDRVNERLVSEMNGKRQAIPLRRAHAVKRAAVAAAFVIAVCGGVTVADAATGGHIRKALYSFFESESYRSGEKVDVNTYVDDRGRYTLEAGDKELVNELNENWDEGRPEWSDDADAHSTGFSTFIGDEDEATVIKSSEDSAIITFSYTYKNGENSSRSEYILGGYPDRFDEEDCEWSMRSELVCGYYETADAGERACFLSELEKLPEKVQKPYAKRAIKKAIHDCRSGDVIAIDYYPITAEQAGVASEDAKDFVDQAWFLVKDSDLKFKNGKSKIVKKSAAGYDMTAKLTIKKDTKYHIDTMEAVSE